MPPAPKGPTISYGPRRSPAERVMVLSEIIASALPEIAGFHDHQVRGIDAAAESGVDLVEGERLDFRIHLRVPLQSATGLGAVGDEADQGLVLRAGDHLGVAIGLFGGGDFFGGKASL